MEKKSLLRFVHMHLFIPSTFSLISLEALPMLLEATNVYSPVSGRFPCWISSMQLSSDTILLMCSSYWTSTLLSGWWGGALYQVRVGKGHPRILATMLMSQPCSVSINSFSSIDGAPAKQMKKYEQHFSFL